MDKPRVNPPSSIFAKRKPREPNSQSPPVQPRRPQHYWEDTLKIKKNQSSLTPEEDSIDAPIKSRAHTVKALVV